MQRNEERESETAGTVSDSATRYVVKLRDGKDFHSDDAEDIERGDRLIEKIRDVWGDSHSPRPVRRLFDFSDEKVRELMKTAVANDESYQKSNLFNYLLVTTPPGLNPDDFKWSLFSLGDVERVYRQLPAEDPTVDPDDDPRFADQRYLGDPPLGLGVSTVWPKKQGGGIAGADGAGVALVDMELGWTLGHEDLKRTNLNLLFGKIENGSREHGTSVLGVIAANDNNFGCVGIVPNIKRIGLVSYEADSRTDRPNAIAAAAADLDAGDVLVIEAQITVVTNPPIESLDAEFKAIRAATAKGIIVVEAAGNGGANIDSATSVFGDSGAIIVGAASGDVMHRKLKNSNFGKRVNCYGWGENVCTLTSNVSGATSGETTAFRGTSAATAMIAGVAAAVQGMAKQKGKLLTPSAMRKLLSNRETGTLSLGDRKSGGAVDLIGVMPNLIGIAKMV